MESGQKRPPLALGHAGEDDRSTRLQVRSDIRKHRQKGIEQDVRDDQIELPFHATEEVPRLQSDPAGIDSIQTEVVGSLLDDRGVEIPRQNRARAELERGDRQYAGARSDVRDVERAPPGVLLDIILQQPQSGLRALMIAGPKGAPRIDVNGDPLRGLGPSMPYSDRKSVV